MLKPGRAAGRSDRGRITALAMSVLFASLAFAGTACSSGGRETAGHETATGSGDPATDAATILARYRATPAADVGLALRVKPAKGDALNFQMHLWCAPDGRVRIIASRLDVDFCSALLRPDGGYTVVLPRAHLAAVGTFGDAERVEFSPFFTHTALISDELRSGPLPAHGPWHATPPTAGDADPRLSVQVDAGITADCTWNPGTGLVTAKSLTCAGADGIDTVTIAYSHDHDFDGLLRPTLATVTVAGAVGSTADANETDPPRGTSAATVTIGLRSFDGTGAISDERMHLEVPADAKTVPLDELLKHLGD